METEEILVAIQKAAETIATPNWADILSVVISLLAVVVAGFVAWRQYGITKMQNDISQKQAEIAEQQNKIALFEKRFSVYETARKCVYAANRISAIAGNLDDVYHIFYVEFVGWQSLNPTDIKNKNTALFFDITDILFQSEFLFSKEISEKISAMAAYLLMLAAVKYRDNPDEIFESAKNHFCQYAEDIDSSNMFKLIKKDLQLQSINFQG